MCGRKAVIVGAGVAGLLTGRLLSQAGVDVDIYDAYDGILPVGAGLTLWPNATRVLRKAGILETLLYGRCQPFRKALIYSRRGVVLGSMSFDRFDAPAVGILRYTLLSTIAEGIDSRRIHYNQRCIQVKDTGDGAYIQFDDGTSNEADIVIIADGIRSLTLSGAEQSLRYSGYTSWRGITAIPEQLNSHASIEVWGRGKRFGYVPISEDRCFWFATMNAPANQKVMSTQSVAEQFTDFSKWIPSIIERTDDSSMLQTDIYDRPPALPYVISRNVLRIGDAAHPMTPNLGQGACMAIEDSYFLATLLTQKMPPQQAFLEFEKRRWERTSRIVQQSWIWGKVTQSNNTLACIIRDSITRLTPTAVQNRMLARLFHNEN